MASKKKLKIGFWMHGIGRTWHDWRHPSVDPSASTSIRHYVNQAKAAERGKFDFLFIADALYITEKSHPHYLSRFEPLTLLSALAMATEHVGLVATVSITYSEPFNIARQFYSLDHISGGRAGFNVVTSTQDDNALNFSKSRHPTHSDRYQIAGEYLDVVQGLWDSWEEGALIGDKASGVFFDPTKLHPLNHEGAFYQVKGPLSMMRSRQGQPVLFQAGASPVGRSFAAARADCVFSLPDTIEASRAHVQDIKARARQSGRDEDSVLVFPGIAPIIGATKEEAKARHFELASLESLETGLGLLGFIFNNHDFSRYDLDAPFPDVSQFGSEGYQSGAKKIVDDAQAETLTLRQVAQRLSAPPSQFVGTAAFIADEMERWLDQGAADGFIIHEPMPGELDRFVDSVVPLLQARGIFREEYEGDTFRANLGIPAPPNRYSVA